MEGEIYRIEQYVEFARQFQRLEGGLKDLVFAHYSLESIVKKALKKNRRSLSPDKACPRARQSADRCADR